MRERERERERLPLLCHLMLSFFPGAAKSVINESPVTNGLKQTCKACIDCLSGGSYSHTNIYLWFSIKYVEAESIA